MDDLLIPLFPLEVVLFPGQRLPLHIFEERYKTMIRECLEGGEPREFGVVLAKENAIVNVGCTAEVVEVTRRYPDGRLDIVAAGRRRFEVLFVDESKDYLRAAAQFFQDDESSAPETLHRSVLELQKQVLQLLPQDEQEEEGQSKEGREKPSPGSAHPLLSFRVAGPLPLDLDFKQLLLTMRSESERLERVVEYFQRLLPRLRLAAWARAKAGGNGHCR